MSVGAATDLWDGVWHTFDGILIPTQAFDYDLIVIEFSSNVRAMADNCKVTNGFWGANVPNGCRLRKSGSNNYAYEIGGFSYVKDTDSTMQVSITLQVESPEDLEY